MGRRTRESERFVATVLFTDMVSSTEIAAELGDRGWRQLLGAHHGLVRAQLRRFGGKEIDTSGDGFFASFNAPAAAIRCAEAIAEGMWDLGVQVRAGLHLGECELIDGKVGGIAVHIGARVASAAGAGDILVTGTVKDAVTGSDIRFEDAGVRALKGVPGDWHLFKVQQEERTRPRPALVRPAPPEPRGVDPRRPSPLVVTLVAILLLAGTLAGYFVVNRGQPDHVTAPERTPSSLVPGVAQVDPRTGRLSDTVPIDLARVALFPMGAGGGFVWVLEHGTGFGKSIAKVNAATHKVVGHFSVGGYPLLDFGIAYCGGSVWVAAIGPTAGQPDVLYRVSPKTNLETGQVSLLETGFSVSGLACGFGAVWAATTDGRLLRINTRTLVRDVGSLGPQIGSLAVDERAVWTIDPLGDKLIQVDPRTLSISKKVPLSFGPTAIAAGFDGVWVTDQTSGVVQKFPAQGTGGSLSASAGPAPFAVTVGNGFVWVLGGQGTLTQVDPSSVAAVRTVHLVSPVAIASRRGKFVGSLAVSTDGVWVTVNVVGIKS